MCEQTEINYLDGDVVWVKLGACWWPGQVTGFHNLPEDIQTEFQKKPLIAVVKFFQEDTYEFVKNYQQIYKYNCTQKDEFIKKGLDKYRSKNKDGSRYMDKFPGDVEIAEKLTGGDPEILNYEKFSPEEKPDISALFGDKKIPKRKRDRDDTQRRSDGIDLMRKITHPRFLKESDHEVRIRQQPGSLPSTPNNSTGSPQYPCHLCSFTSSRVNVIICHIKSHKSGNSPMAKTKVKSYSQHRSKVVDADTPKRKYVRKEKVHKSKSEYNVESGKRKQPKQIEKATKKKKTDPKIRDTILADWEDESDDDTSLNQRKSIDSSMELNTLPTKAESDLEIQEEFNKKTSSLADSSEIIEQTEKLLKETENLTSLQTVDTSAETITISKSLKSSSLEESVVGTEKGSRTSESTTDEPSNKVSKEKEASDSDHENKCSFSGKGDKKALLSCFDFHEEEVSVPPVRKKSRAFHQKKEIIKEFEMSQALKNEQKEREAESSRSIDQEEPDKIIKKHNTLDAQISNQDVIEDEVTQDNEIPVPEIDSTPTKNKAKIEAIDAEQTPKDSTQTCETELEIVEIFEVEREDVNTDNSISTEKSSKVELKNKVVSEKALPTDKTTTVENEPPFLESKSITDDKQLLSKDASLEDAITEAMEQASTKETEETLSERFTTETEDETVSESAETLPEQSENSDADMLDPDQHPSKEASSSQLSSQQQDRTPSSVKKRRGRPRKNFDLTTAIGSDAELAKTLINKNNEEVIEMERRISESDTERSYTGRRRKPNKKYVECDIYVQDIDQRPLKTDESQSESDDRSSEKIKGKTKKGRKVFPATDKKKTETIQDIQEKELEITDTLDAFDNTIVAPKFDASSDLHQTILNETKTLIEPKNKLIEDQICQNDAPSLEESRKQESPTKDKNTLLPQASNSLVEDNATFVLPAAHKVEKGSEEILKEKDDRPSKELETSEKLSLKTTTEKGQLPDTSDTVRNIVDMLPPKKSQIKKFELSQLDFFEENTVAGKSVLEIDRNNITRSTKEGDAGANKDVDGSDSVGIALSKITSAVDETDPNAKIEQMPSDVCADDKKIEKSEGGLSVKEKVTEELKSRINLQPELNISEVPIEESKSSDQQAIDEPLVQVKAKERSATETGVSTKKGLPEEKAVNTFQEAFLKTLHMDKKKLASADSESATLKGKKGKKVMKRKLEDNEKLDTMFQDINVGEEQVETSASVCKIKIDGDSTPIAEISMLEGIKIEDKQKVQVEATVKQENVENPISCSSEPNTSKAPTELPVVDDSKSASLHIESANESSGLSISTASSSSEATIPVKKREMPRIIENVTLTEPVQILKSKLLDKIPQKSAKHKLDSDTVGKGEQKCSPKAKIMKIDNLPSNNKSKQGKKMATSSLPLSKKMQLLKSDGVETTRVIETHNEQSNIQTSQSATSTTREKYIQQSSQSLAEMELDINSMPFVLSDDVLTPESIEQMPVVISSIIPASSTMPVSLSLTTTTQTVAPTQTQLKSNESHSEISPTKKKSGTPAILKAKNKAKPTITSIKTIVPPLTGGVKGIKFQNTQSSKSAPLLTQKGAPGKYVVVQTSGGQQLRYTVQGKSGGQQKIAIPTGKGAANAQLVQQGGKVVILTSAQSGQTKMLPLNITKSLGGKVQRIITSKGQVLCSLNPQSIITSKTVITPKGDGILPTTSKLTPSHKIINTQGIITSKGVLTPIPETIAKSGLLGTLPQGILTKGGIYTPISTTTLGGKTIIGSKSLVAKGTTILSSQNMGTSKAILTSISPSICGKTILTTQGLVSTKGTVLTPITGQQVKAIAAKSPSKGSKVQYQSVQQKVQLPMLHKSQKIAMSPTTQGKQGQLKAASSTLVVQSASASHKNVLPGRKVVKQSIIQPSPTLQNIVPQTGMQQTVGIVQQIQQKGKTGSTMQKVIMPRGSGRQTKSQQKILVQKLQEPSISAVQNIQTKQILPISSTSVASVSKGVAQQKYIVGSSSSAKSISKSQTPSKSSHQQKNLLHIAMNATATSSISTNVPTTLSLPTSESIEPEKKLKSDHMAIECTPKEQCKVEKLNLEKGTGTEKLDEPKISAQPQIMALPTESSDGTQTYVLVTIDEQGQIQPLDNNTLMSLEGTTQNPDGTRTLYIDPSSLGEAGAIDNIVLQFDNGVLPGLHSSGTESTAAVISESFHASDVIQTSNQDILAAALANTDFQQEISLPENPASSIVNAGLTQTSLINQTILQSTIIPPTEPISSPSVLETSLTLNQPIMTPLEVPTSLPIQSVSTPTTGIPTIPTSLELPITITNPNISYISTGDSQIQIPANSMPDIGSIIENPTTVEIAPTEHSDGTQYLVISNLEGNVSDKSQASETTAISISNTPYSVSIPGNIVLQTSTVQTTPSMPIIDDTFADTFSTTMKSIPKEQSFVDAPVSEMLIPKSVQSKESSLPQEGNITTEILISSNVPVSLQESIASTEESTISHKTYHASMPLEEIYSSQEVPITSEELILQQTITKEDNTKVPTTSGKEEIDNDESIVSIKLPEHTSESMTCSMPIVDESSLIAPESSIKMKSVEGISFEVTDSSGVETSASKESNTIDKLKELSFSDRCENKVHSETIEEQASTSNEVEVVQQTSQTSSTVSKSPMAKQNLDASVDVKSPIYTASSEKQQDECQRDEPSSHDDPPLVPRNLELQFNEANDETSHETPSQSYDQFGISMTSGSADLPSQSLAKSENSREPTQSVPYEPMETDDEPIATEPPTQSFQHAKIEASQSYESSEVANTNAPTQSFNEVMQNQKEVSIEDEAADDQTFPTQSYEVDKANDTVENLETDAELSQEGNIPSQSNDIGVDGIGTSSVSTNNSALNEDETASSSYVPETPENQERDQDQESAISTSSYEIPPCEELNIGSSSVIPDTSVRAEHTSIHDNGVPEIPTSSYNLNPDITSTHVDSIPTSSYEDQVIVEQNVSTSFEVPMSMPGLEETCSQNFVTESSDHRNEPSSYYAHNQEVTASYYEPVDQESNSRLDGDSQEEATPSYYEGNQQEASQSYFHPEEASQSYSGHNVSASYYDPRPESEASQSYYSADDMEKTEQASSQNIEASQSFYQEQTDELKLQQQGEATPAYSERYPVDYTLDHSPIERHDLVESSVPATRPMER